MNRRTALLLLFTVMAGGVPAQAPLSVLLRETARGFTSPVRLAAPPDGTGRLFCAYADQQRYEAINLIGKGHNYGWRMMDGRHCCRPASGCNTGKLTLPIAEYSHDEGVSVIGVYCYRGNAFPGLHGYYFFGDWTGKCWYLQKADSTWQRGPVNVRKDSNETDGIINSFGGDEAGNIYVITQKLPGPKSPTGVVYQLSY